MFSTDNIEDAPTFKFCHQHHKRVLNPIVDWTTEEVWEFIKENELPYCDLYDKGYTRLGCIGCPMSTRQGDELDKYPKFKALYLKAFDKMIKNLTDAGKVYSWTSAENVMEWWIHSGFKNLPKDTDITDLIDD